MIQPHSSEWYDRLSQMQNGYYYPWKSTLSLLNGEDEYLQMLEHLLTPEMVVLDVGCGHGEVPIRFASRCQWMVAYDPTMAFIEMAQKTAVSQNIPNISIIQADSLDTLLASPELPSHIDKFDMIISRRGPMDWVERVRQIAKPGTMMFVLNPKESILPVWNDHLPEILRAANPRTYSRQQSVERRLGIAGLKLQSAWAFDVLEHFATPQDLYNKLSWGYTADEVPPFTAVSPTIIQIFAEYADEKGLALPHGRFMWQAIVD